jgi:hypothetical protein
METTRHKEKLSHGQLHDRIAAVEQRLERRRARLLDDAQETGTAASHAATRALPIAAAVGAGLLAMWMTRRHRTSKVARPHYRVVEVEPGDARRGLRWASIAGIIGSAIRIGTHPQVRAIVRNLGERRRRY